MVYRVLERLSQIRFILKLLTEDGVGILSNAVVGPRPRLPELHGHVLPRAGLEVGELAEVRLVRSF